MADQCFVIVDVAGEPDDVARFRDEVSGVTDEGETSDFVLATFMPEPDEFMGLDDDLPRAIWRQRNWGCKWEPEDVLVEERPWGIRYRFVTPYSPVNPWLFAVAEVVPELSFRMIAVVPDTGMAAWLDITGTESSIHVIDVPADAEDWAERVAAELAAVDAADLVPAED